MGLSECNPIISQEASGLTVSQPTTFDIMVGIRVLNIFELKIFSFFYLRGDIMIVSLEASVLAFWRECDNIFMLPKLEVHYKLIF